MEKLLKLVFFKTKGFSSKTDGMKFIKSQEKLENKIHYYDEEIEIFKSELITKFSKYFDKFDEEKELFLKEIKKEEKQKRAIRKKIRDSEHREELKNEIRRELKLEEKEKTLELLEKKYKKMIPQRNELQLSDIINKFYQIVKFVDANSIEMNIERKKSIIKMCQNMNKIINTLTILSNKLDKYIPESENEYESEYESESECY